MSNLFETAKFKLGDYVLLKQELANDRYALEYSHPEGLAAGLTTKTPLSQVWVVARRIVVEDLAGPTFLQYCVQATNRPEQYAAEAELELYAPKESD